MATAATSRAKRATRRRKREAFRKLLGDEAGRQLPVAPAWMAHHGGKEGDVVANAVEREGIERQRLRLDRHRSGRCMRDELGDHRVVVDRNLAALAHAGIVTDVPFAERPFSGGR